MTYLLTPGDGEDAPEAVQAAPGLPDPQWDRSRFGDVLAILRRNRWLILGCSVLLAGATAFFTARLTPVYSTAASIRIDDAQSSASVLRPMGLVGGGEITTELEMLRSRMLAEAVVDSLALQVALVRPLRIAREEVFSEVAATRQAQAAEYRLEALPEGRFVLRDSLGASLAVVAAGEEIEVGGVRLRLARGAGRHSQIVFSVREFPEAVNILQSSLRVSRRGREANLVDVSYESSDPRLVRTVPNALAAHFIADRQSVHQAQARSTVGFLRDQIDHISGQLSSAEHALRDFRESERVISIADQASSEVQRAAELQAQLTSLRAESSALGTLLAEVRMAASEDPAGGSSPFRQLVAFPTLLRNQAASSLLNSIASAEDRRAELLTRRSREDEDVKVLSARIEQLEKQLLSIAQTYHAGLVNQTTALQSTLGQMGREMERIPSKEARFAQLKREATVLEEIYTQLQSKLKEAEIAATMQDPNVRLVDAAILPRAPIRPRPLVNVSLALVAGLLLGISAAFAREYADKSVHTRRDVLRATGLPVLGFIPRVEAAALRRALPPRGSRLKGLAASVGSAPLLGRGPAEAAPRPHVLVSGLDAWNPFAEAYNRLETNIAFATHGSQARLIVMTSPLPGDGKTTSAINFAITVAQRGKRVLLVDADLRKGVLNSVFGFAREPGFSDVVSGTTTLRGALRTVPVDGTTSLSVLTAGGLPQNPAQMLRSNRTLDLLRHLRQHFDLVILDAPPLNLVTDAALLGAESDGVIVVARSGVTTAEALAFTMEQLQNVRAPVLGAILNDIDFERDAGYDRSYQYYAHYKAYEVSR